MQLRVKTVAGAQAVIEVDPALPLSVARAQAASALELKLDPPFAISGRLLLPADDEKSLDELGFREGGVVVAVLRQVVDTTSTPSPDQRVATDAGSTPSSFQPPSEQMQNDDDLARQLQAAEDERAARRVQEDLDSDLAREEQVRQAQGDARAEEVAGTPRLLHVRCELPNPVNGRTSHPWIPLMLDTGAQFSVLTSSLAERLGLMERLDRTAAGIAGGVGHARILGKLRGVTVRLGELDLAVDFAVLEGSQLAAGNLAILGLDQLAVHHMVVDLDARVLRIGGCEGYAVRMLESYEVPEEFRPESSVLQRCVVQ